VAPPASEGSVAVTVGPKRDEIVAFLETDPSRAYCDECLRQALGFSAVDVTMSTADLADSLDERVNVAFGWCSACRKRDRVVQFRSTTAN
jgi:hypothetical protein